MQLSPNASGILRDLGVLPGLAAAGLAPDAIHIRRARDGATLARLPLADAERRWGGPYLNVHRADLVRILRETALADPNVSFHPQTILAGFEQTANGVRAVGLRGPIRIGFEADCLIGATACAPSSVRAAPRSGANSTTCRRRRVMPRGAPSLPPLASRKICAYQPAISGSVRARTLCTTPCAPEK